MTHVISDLSVNGLVDMVIRNDDGTIAAHEHIHNMHTDIFRQQFVLSNSGFFGSSDTHIFINENTEPMSYRKSFWVTALPGVVAQTVPWSIDGVSRLWTASTVFGNPPSNRTFRTIGIGRGGEGPYGAITRAQHVTFAATVLSQSYTQLTTQTLEIVYRLAFSRT